MSEPPKFVNVDTDTSRPWYRVVLSAGSTWAETSDLTDARVRLREVEHLGARIQRCFMVRGTTPWEDFDVE